MKKILCIGLVLAIIISVTGCGTLGKTQSQYLDKEETPATLMYVSGADDINTGDLYYQEINKDKEKITDKVVKGQYTVSQDKKTIAYLETDGNLYVKEKDKESQKISDRVAKSSFTFCGDESTVAFIRTDSEEESTPSSLYICKIGDEKEKVTSDMAHYADKSSYFMDKSAKSIYFINSAKELYSYSNNGDKEKLAKDVVRFNLNTQSDSYTYLTGDNSYYVKWRGEQDSQKVATENVGSLKISGNGYMSVFSGDYNYDKGFGELYIVIKDSDRIKVASDVKTFMLTPDASRLYYLNDEGALYLKKLPTVDKNTCEKTDEFIKDVNSREKVKLCVDVKKYSVNESGDMCLALDNDSNLYLTNENGDKTKVDSDVSQVFAYTDSFLYLNASYQMFRNSNPRDDAKNMKDNCNMIAQSVSTCSTSKYGKYVVYTTALDNAVYVCDDGQQPQKIVDDKTIYDCVLYKNTAVYEKKLALADIVGNYINSDLNVAYKITSDSKFIQYKIGAESENGVFSASGEDKISLKMTSANSDSILASGTYIFTKNLDKTTTLTVNGKVYKLNGVSDADLNNEIARQKKQEEDRKAAEAKKAAEEKRKAELAAKKAKLEQQGKNFLANGVYVDSYETLYYSPSYSDASTYTYTYSGIKDVYDYKVSADGETLWLEVYTYSSSGYYDYYYDGYTGYIWVCK